MNISYVVLDNSGGLGINSTGISPDKGVLACAFKFIDVSLRQFDAIVPLKILHLDIVILCVYNRFLINGRMKRYEQNFVRKL